MWFLVEIPNKTPIDMPKYPGEKIWHASKGLGALCNVIFFSLIGLFWIRQLLKVRKKQPTPQKQTYATLKDNDC